MDYTSHNHRCLSTKYTEKEKQSKLVSNHQFWYLQIVGFFALLYVIEGHNPFKTMSAQIVYFKSG